MGPLPVLVVCKVGRELLPYPAVLPCPYSDVATDHMTKPLNKKKKYGGKRSSKLKHSKAKKLSEARLKSYGL